MSKNQSITYLKRIVLIIQAAQTEANEVDEFNFIPFHNEWYLPQIPLNDKDTDGFIHKDDIKQICRNINATNQKYYANFDDLYHFTSIVSKFREKSLPDYKS